MDPTLSTIQHDSWVYFLTCYQIFKFPLKSMSLTCHISSHHIRSDMRFVLDTIMPLNSSRLVVFCSHPSSKPEKETIDVLKE